LKKVNGGVGEIPPTQLTEHHDSNRNRGFGRKKGEESNKIPKNKNIILLLHILITSSVIG
jgi:hypothetical protein